VSSLEEVNQLVQEYTEDQYNYMAKKAQFISYLIRNGYFTKKLFVDSMMVIDD